MRICKIEEQKETLAEAIEKFLAYKKAQQVSARTMRDYVSYLGDFLNKSSNSLEAKELAADVLDYFSKIPNTSPARFNHPYQALSALFNWAIRQDLIAKNPLTSQGIQKKKDDGNIKPADIADVKIFLDSIDRSTFAGLRNYLVILVMLDTGMRTCEAIRLKDENVDLAAKQILVSKHISKTRKNRTVYISDSTAKLLAKYMRIKPDGWSEYLFPTREGGQMRTEGLDLEIARQCKKAGVKFTPYQLRHTFASYFVANGGDLFTLQDIMGHTDLRMTRRYTELDNENKKRAHNIYTPINALQGAARLVKI